MMSMYTALKAVEFAAEITDVEGLILVCSNDDIFEFHVQSPLVRIIRLILNVLM